MKDGMNYAPKGKQAPVVGPGEFVFAATHLDHGHIYGQCNGLTEAGGVLKSVYEPDPEKRAAFCKAFPGVTPVDSLDRILEDPEVRMVAVAAMPNLRGELGCRVMRAGKDYFTDKTPFTTLDQRTDAREAVAATGRKFMVYFSERLHSECAVFAGELVREGAIGKVIEVIGFGPHRLSASSRPAWFFEREKYGGILCDIGSHQFEQFLFYSGARDATILSATTGRQILSGSTGSPRTPRAHGETGARSFWEQKAASSCASMWTSAAARAGTSSTWSINCSKNATSSPARSGSRFLASSSWTRSTGPRRQ